MRVRLSSHIRSYTRGLAEVEADGQSVGAVMADLERRYPGIRFRLVDEQGQIRPHINVFVGQSLIRDVSHRVEPHEEISILAALSGG